MAYPTLGRTRPRSVVFSYRPCAVECLHELTHLGAGLEVPFAESIARPRMVARRDVGSSPLLVPAGRVDQYAHQEKAARQLRPHTHSVATGFAGLDTGPGLTYIAL